MPVDKFITNEFFQVFLVFCRVGSCMMFVPGFGDAAVNPRVRLCFGLILSIALVHAVPPLPKLPGDAARTLILLVHELTIGIVIGSMIKVLTSSLHVAGTIMGMQSSLAQASLFDPSQQTQSPAFGAFLQMMSVVVIFALDFHHMIISGLVWSYSIFEVTANNLPWDDFADLATKTVSSSFAVGLQIAGPIVVTGILINIISGLLARLMPSFQVFFVVMPLQITLSLFVFIGTISSMMLIYMNYLDSALIDIFPQK